jgi:hypothetical protein
VFCYPWHAAAAAKIWGVPFADPLLIVGGYATGNLRFRRRLSLRSIC